MRARARSLAHSLARARPPPHGGCIYVCVYVRARVRARARPRVYTVTLERVVHCEAYNGTHPRHTGKRVLSLPLANPPVYTRVSVNMRVYARERSYMHRIQVPDYNTIARRTYR